MSIEKNKEWQREIVAQWYADMYEMKEREIIDVEFALSIIGNNPKKILEIGCGSGRFLVPFAKAGHNIIGLDIDDDMLKKISSKMERSQTANWQKSDVLLDKWPEGFDVIIFGANFFLNILTNIDYKISQKILIEKASKSINPGGHLFIDFAYTHYPEKWFDNTKPNIIWEGIDQNGNEGRMILLNSQYDKTTRINTFIRRFEMTLADGFFFSQNILEKKHILKLEQIHEWLHDFGFEIENEYGDYLYNPVGENSIRAIIWARKID